MMWSKEEYIIIIACVLGVIIMLLHEAYHDDRIVSALIVPISMMIYARHLLQRGD